MTVPNAVTTLPDVVRAKFIVAKIDVHGPTSRTIVLRPVYSQDPRHENKTFWDATPSGELTMTINNPHAAYFFDAGGEYYIDFSAAPHDPSVRAAIDKYDELRANALKVK